MIPLLRLLEVTAYALLSFLPFLFLAIWPFRKRLRFSMGATNALVVVACLVRITMGMLAAFSGANAGLLTVLKTGIYTALYFIVIKSHPGKLLFTLLTLTNIANLVAVCAKCLEGMLFGEFALQPYRWSLCLCMLMVSVVVVLPLHYYITAVYTRIMKAQLATWRYLWVVPAIFYLIWFYHLYLTGQSDLEVALNVYSTLFLVLINIGALAVYHTELMLLVEKEKAQELAAQNHRLTMQKIQYDNLQSRLNEARQARHDVRHHIHLIREYLRDGKLQELESYLENYDATLYDTHIPVYCQNYAVNALLGFFVQQAADFDVKTDVCMQLPEQLELPETTLSVVLGNLLENALEACCQNPDGQRKITVRGKADKGSVFFMITNPYVCELRRSKSGKFLSTKSEHRGIGLESVASVVQGSGGMMEVETENGIFRVSVLLTETNKI